MAAAVSVAAEQGLAVDEAIPVGTGSNVIVHLRPHPIVARVMSGTVVLHPDPRAWLAREIDVVRFLRSRGAPVLAPTEVCAAGPFERGGLWLSLWEFAETVDAPISGRDAGVALRRLHGALADYRGRLPPRATIWDEIDVMLAAAPDPLLRAEADRLRPLTAGVDADAQPLHGDAGLANLLHTPDGPRFNDFEDVCSGSVAWDVVGVEQSVRHRGGDIAGVQAGYGRRFEPAVLDILRAVDDLYGAAWRGYLVGVR